MDRQESTGRGEGVRPQGVRPPRFTGRERELAALANALARPSAVVLVEGEAGIGKSRLVREFLDSGPGRRDGALVVYCPPFRQPHTLGPLVDALRRAAVDGASGLGLSALGGALRSLFPEWAPGLPPALEPAEDASAARHRVFAALAELLGCLNVGLLVVEDVHWADEATLEFLLYLTSGMPAAQSLVVTYRPEEVPPRSLLRRLSRVPPGVTGLRLAVSPLGMAETAGLVSSMLAGAHLSEEFAAFVHDRTDGVPLAVEESVRVMSERADLAGRDGEWVRRHLAKIDVPPTVRDAVLERVGRLTADAHAMLWAAAVLAVPEPEGLLAAVAGLRAERARDGLIEALASGLLGEDDRGLIAFRHALMRQTVYEDIPGPQRRAMHLRAGQEVEGISPLPLARLARHFREARDAGRWFRYAEQAASQARAAGDETTEAILLHDLIISAGLPAAEVTRLASKIVLLSLPFDHQLLELVQTLRAALDAGKLTAAEEAGFRFQLGRTLWTMGEHDASRAELEQAVAHLPLGSLPAARAMMLLGQPQDTRCPAPVHLRWLSKAAKATGSLEAGEKLRLAIDHATALLLLGKETGWAVAAELPDGEPATAQRLQTTRAHVNIAEAAMIWGRYPEARRRLERALQLAGRYGYPLMRTACLVDQAQLDWLTGAWHGLAERAYTLAGDESLQPLTRLQALLVTGLLQAAQGTSAEAMEQLQRVLDGTLCRGAVDSVMIPAAALARLYLARGETAMALKITDEPAAIVARKGIWIWAADLAPARASALAAAGRTGEAAALVMSFARGLRGRNATAPAAGLVLCRAILAEARGEHVRAAALYGRAATAWQVLPRPYEALLARERQAEHLIAAGRAEAALDVLAGAERELSELGATRDADRVARRLREHGMPVPRAWRGGRRGYGSRLSPREFDVVRLIIAGHTNRQIAEALHRSQPTVATQLKSAMRKLGVSSRTALAAVAATAGIAPEAGPRQESERSPGTR